MIDEDVWAAWVEERSASTRQAAAWAKAELLAKGAGPPPDAEHADLWDPPLSMCEVRHAVHAFQRQPQEACRFCVAIAVTSLFAPERAVKIIRPGRPEDAPAPLSRDALRCRCGEREGGCRP